MGIDWHAISNEIKEKLDTDKLYFDDYSYSSSDDVLYGVVPNEPKSFKPKVLNILILGTNYGHSADGFDFTPIIAAMETSRQKLVVGFEKFVSYETWIYLDMYSANIDPDPTYATSLSETGAALSQFCIDNAALGLIYKGDLLEENSSDDLTAEIIKWYNKKYRI